ncbi:hypothetical protein BV25DRAFT_1912460 [Artomyces pyxidatus]|uniref:Uncharacterized protein n=1 Tax=Artomyces pyxidatus TaxID=48021 RepID=A0ACB8TFD9_9AGAM|nr:hypothetical protein BV25DRAFT_1912460 [Artomyces pyxidatus]
MSFITAGDGRILVRERWPGKVAKANDLPASFAYDMVWQRCPNTVEGLLKWGYFTHNPDQEERLKRQFVFAHKLSGSDEIFPGRLVEEVRLRIQGFVEHAQLNPTGNWNGTREGASLAERKLILGGGKFPKIFRDQVVALANVGELGRMSLCPRENDAFSQCMTKDDKIICRWPASKDDIESMLEDSTDGNSTASSTASSTDTAENFGQWGLRYRLRAYEGEPLVTTWHAIRAEDFVEVEAVVRVSTGENNPTGFPRVSFTLHPVCITRLCRGREVAMVRIYIYGGEQD